MKPIKNIILDWSGTLVDDFSPVLEASNKIFEEYGKPVFTAEQFREKFFLPFQDFYRIYLPEVTMEELDTRYHSSFKFLQENVTILPEAREFLDYCVTAEMPMFLLSTIHAQHFEAQGERLKLKSYFTKAYTQAYDKRKTILQLLAENGLNADETLFIGDMKHDVEAARHGGVRSCAVLTGYDSLNKLKQAEPDLIFRDLGQVQRYLERHRQGHDEKPPLATVGALIFNDQDQVLMVQTYKWSNLWGIPGGKIKRGETAEEGLRREIKEETGLEVTDVRYVMVQDCIDSKEFYRPAHFLLLNYTARALSTEIQLNDEADQWKWVGPEEALRMNLNQPTRTLIEAVLKVRHSDRIEIDGLELNVHIGVPDSERAQPQKIRVSLTLELGSLREAAVGDDLRATVNYYDVAQSVKALAASKPRKLIETLAHDIAGECLKFDQVESVLVRLEKYILPDARCVAVEITRKR